MEVARREKERDGKTRDESHPRSRRDPRRRKRMWKREETAMAGLSVGHPRDILIISAVLCVMCCDPCQFGQFGQFPIKRASE